MATLMFENLDTGIGDDLDASDLDKEVDRFRHDEVLRAIAVRMEGFVEEYPDLEIANAARALLAHIYLHLDQPAKAIPILREFDPEGATTQDILAAALAMPQLEGMAEKLPDMLRAVVVKPVPVRDKFAAVFIAMRLDRVDTAKAMLADIRAAARTVEDRAAVLLEEADLVARLMIAKPVPIEPQPVRPEVFPADPVAAAMLRSTAMPVDDWREVVTADAKTLQRPHLRDAAAFRAKATDLIKAVAPDAMPGLRLMQSVPVYHTKGLDGVVVNPPGIPPIDALPVMPEFIVVGLLHRVANLFPGTRAADLAAAKLYSRRMTRGTEPLDLDARTITGGRCGLGDFRGKVVLLDFWSVANPDSLRERKLLADVFRTYNPAGLEIISVSLDHADSLPAVHAVIQQYELSWQQIFEGEGVYSPIARAYDVAAVPARLVIGRNGRVFEIDPTELKPVKIRATIERALREPRPPIVGDRDSIGTDSVTWTARRVGAAGNEPGAVGTDAATGTNARRVGVVGNEPGAVGTDAKSSGRRAGSGDQGSVGVDGYTGPPITNRVNVGGPGVPVYTLSSTVRVPSAGYQFQHNDTQSVNNATHVFLSLVAPSPDEQVATVMETKELDLGLGASPGRFVRVFVKHYMRGVKYDRAPEYRLADVLEIGDVDRLPYVGPPLRAQLVRGLEKPAYTMIAEVDVPSSGYTFKVADVRRTKGSVQVLLDIAPPDSGVIVMPVLETLRVTAPLGAEDIVKVDVLARLRNPAGVDSPYGIVTTLTR